MKFEALPLDGAYVVELEPRSDDRGFFSRTFCAREFEDHGLNSRLVQCNVSYNHVAGTLRGMHMQIAPAEEAKLVRCTSGAVYDVIVDMRQGSATYLEHVGIELDDDARRGLYVPEGFAHGYLTLSDGAEVEYQVSEFYTPATERGFRHDDPALGITWPHEVTCISTKDRSWPLIGPLASDRE